MERILPAETEYKGVPYVGCAATIPVGSDSYPGTVTWVSEQTVEHEGRIYDKFDGAYKTIKVKVPKRLRVRTVQARGAEGWNNAFTENQKYVYYETEEDERNLGREYSYRPKAHRYVEVGTSYRSTAAQGIYFGHRSYYRDPHF